MKKVLSIKRLRKSFGYAFKGIDDVIKHEPNMKIHVVVAILVVIMAFILKVSIIEWIILVLLIVAVLAAETMFSIRNSNGSGVQEGNRVILNLCNFFSSFNLFFGFR